MASLYPGAQDNFTNPLNTDKLNNPDHATQHANVNDAVEALEAKLGTGASTATAGKVLRATGTGVTSFGQVDVTTDLASFTSANLRTLLSDETGTGVAVFGTSPTLTTPIIADFTSANHNHTNAAGGGTLGTGAVSSAAILATGTVTAPKLATELQKGWEDYIGGTQVPAPSTVTYNGNRSYDLVFNSTDLTGGLSNGMRLKLTRTVTAPTQCTSLNGTTQYYSKSSPANMVWTDDFTVSAWIKVSSYASGIICSRYDGTSGWYFYMTASGQLQLQGNKAGAGNSSYVVTYQSVPLNKWVHVTAQLDMSTFTATPTTSYVMINGLDVPASVARAGTNPTDLTQAGNLEIGSYNGGSGFFPGKIAQVGIFSGKITQATMRSYMSQTFAGNEASLISAYSFNNSINDLTSSANNLTANGSAVATNADSPFGQQANGTTAGTTEYGIITAATFSTNTTLTVQVPEGNAIPTSGGVSAVSYSSQKVPYGFPPITNVLNEILYLNTFSSATIAGTDVTGLTTTLTPPVGKSLRIKLVGLMLKSGSAGDALALEIVEDSTIIQKYLINMPGSNYQSTVDIDTPEFKPTSGSHTYKVTMDATGAGTMQFVGNTANRSYLRVECVDL